MDITTILIAVAVVAGVGVIIGILLGVAGEKFKVPVDEKAVMVRELLPGNNCGGCGYPGCDGLAAAIARVRCRHLHVLLEVQPLQRQSVQHSA